MNLNQTIYFIIKSISNVIARQNVFANKTVVQPTLISNSHAMYPAIYSLFVASVEIYFAKFLFRHDSFICCLSWSIRGPVLTITLLDCWESQRMILLGLVLGTGVEGRKIAS